ncbi:MAG: CZB domain-containing protein [Nitrospira sp.]
MSNILEQIDKAIGAHGAWKVKLRQNIDGTLALNPAEVSVDNRCDFGKWLYSLTGGQTSDPHYKEVLTLHAAFHRAAAGVVTKVQKGDKAGAEASIGLNGDYASASSKLTAKMMEWKRVSAKAA